MRLSLIITILSLTMLLAGCASEPMPNMQNPVVHEFYRAMLSSLNQQAGPAKAALQAGANGTATVDFQYADDGTISNVRLVTRPQDNRVDDAALYAVKHAVFPTKPSIMDGTDHFEANLVIAYGITRFTLLLRQPGNKIESFGGA